MFKAAQFMQKATATFMQSEKNWHKSSSKITEGLKLAINYMTSKLSTIGWNPFWKEDFFCTLAFSQDLFEILIQPRDRNISWKCRCMKIRMLNPKCFYSILLSNLLAELFWKVSQFFSPLSCLIRLYPICKKGQ